MEHPGIMEQRIPVDGGRQVSIRVPEHGTHIQLGIVSTYGNLIEAVTFQAAQRLGVIGALERAGEASDERSLATEDRDLMGRLAEITQEARAEPMPSRCERSHRLSREATFANADGTRSCRECRGERNVEWRRRRGLRPLRTYEVMPLRRYEP